MRESIVDKVNFGEKFLVVSVNWLGDCVMSLPIFKAIKDKFPGAFLAVMTTPRVKELFENIAYIDEVIEFDERTKNRSFFAKIRFIKELRKRRFDVAFFLHRSFTRILICALSGIKKRIGYKRKKTSFLLTIKITPPQKDSLHRADYYFYLFEKVQIPVKDRIPHLAIKEKEENKIHRFFVEHKKRYSYTVAINPSSNWNLKSWPIDYFVELIKEMISQKICVLLIGTKKEERIANEIVKKVGLKDLFSFCGKTTLKELLIILKGVDMLISSDSGPAHLSSAVGTSTVVLFGPTSPYITAPKGDKVVIIRKDIGCRIPCYKLDCRDNRCMKEITPQLVWSIIKPILYGKSQICYKEEG